MSSEIIKLGIWGRGGFITPELGWLFHVLKILTILSITWFVTRSRLRELRAP